MAAGLRAAPSPHKWRVRNGFCDPSSLEVCTQVFLEASGKAPEAVTLEGLTALLCVLHQVSVCDRHRWAASLRFPQSFQGRRTPALPAAALHRLALVLAGRARQQRVLLPVPTSAGTVLPTVAQVFFCHVVQTPCHQTSSRGVRPSMFPVADF